MAATANERIKGIQVHRPIIYGSHARLLTEEEKALAPIGHTHRWTVFFTSAATPPPDPSSSSSSSTKPLSKNAAQDGNTQADMGVDMDYMPGGQDDLSYLIKKVTFRLHETYPNPNRVCDKPPFKVTETGWGEFVVQIRIQFIPESLEKPITLNHPIKLHHWGAPIEGVVESLQHARPGITAAEEGSVAPTEEGGAGTGTAATSAANTPAPDLTAAAAAGTTSGSVDIVMQAEGGDEKKDTGKEGKSEGRSDAGDIKVEGAGGDDTISSNSQAQQPTPRSSNVSAPATAPAGTPAIESKPEATAEAEGGNDSMVTESEIVVDTVAAAARSQAEAEAKADAEAEAEAEAQPPLSIASILPVHSWQYDELIFSDPPRAFLDILNENPPTPLPAKNRRPRDQRDEYEKKHNNQMPASKKGKSTPSNGPGGARGGTVSARGSRANTEVGGTPGPSAGAGASGSITAGIPGEPGSADVPLEFSREMERGEYNKLMDARRKIVEQMDKWRERLIAQEKELNKLKDEVKAM
ncbi:hypothetical protein I316_00418 [Kwoniella heveanensis BCC8398]|uniref:YEATS domain-containing protein n=1 Tax=Kwoniella heveanensis BCC8398 TaxID=1296120 RepID=A0A1B9H4J5_9TREE|nr:hypothetical protein I316_00418 [Kwoniella heveanensis BCC8398]